jgi:hypothetical protein
MNATESARLAVTINGNAYPYISRWSGQRLLPADGYLALDTKTEVVNWKRAIPRLALAAASADTKVSCLIHPDDVGTFVIAHRHLHLVAHDAAVAFWAIEEMLRRRGEEAARRAWWRIAEDNRLHDPQLLDVLVRLAVEDTLPTPRDLATVAREYAGLVLDADDPFRTQYGEVIGADWSLVHPGFFTHSITHAIALRPAYLAVRRQARAVADDFNRYSRDVRGDARERFGLLTESVQVKKAIALAQITRNGLRVDRARLLDAERDLRQRLDEAVRQVLLLCPELYRTGCDGKAVPSGKAGTPSLRPATLLEHLGRVRDEIARESVVEIVVPPSGTARQPSTARKVWAQYRHQHPFLGHWIEVEELSKLLQFITALKEDEVHPEYAVLVRTGRTSCRDPNIQQVPRVGTCRQAFVASPGHLLLAVDYASIELRTLAAHLLHHFGRSALAEVFQTGVDPHAYTAALMSGVPLDEFLSWEGRTDTIGGEALGDRYVTAREAAKPVNFGVCAGLSARGLREYARDAYGVTLTEEEAQQRRDLLIRKVYPELDLYLAEDTAAVLARNLRTTADAVRAELGDVALAAIRKILAGEPVRVDGRPYSATFVSQVWASLAGLNRHSVLTAPLLTREPGRSLSDRVCCAGVATLTGRIRGRVSYAQARTTPSQGLAADGAALALFALVKEGFRVVGFIHDEVLIELPDEGGFVAEATVNRVTVVMCRAMAEVLVGGIPVTCKAALSRRWSKEAKLIARDGKVYPWQPDHSPNP